MMNISGNVLVIKEINTNLIRQALKQIEQGTKLQIAKMTGLSTVTVGTILEAMKESNEIYETKLMQSNGGRPAQAFSYNFDLQLSLVIFPFEKNNTIFLSSTVFNLAGKSTYEEIVEVEDINLSILGNEVEKMFVLYPSISAIGFGSTGVEIDGVIIISDYKALVSVEFKKYFYEKYKVPIMIENDVNAAVVGYGKRKNITNQGILIYLYFPDKHPPGAGILIDGELHKGKTNYAGEVASMPIGIEWNEDLYQSFDEFCKAATKIIMILSFILNPDEVIINGNFITQEHLNLIEKNCKEQILENILPEIFISEKFISDYKTGLIVNTLKELEAGISLTRKKV